MSNTWADPLAQSFIINNNGVGAFLTKVDIFFATKDANIPVSLEIREMVNGYPGTKVLPFSKVTLKPSMVNVSSNTVTLDGSLVPDYNTPTTFTFDTPVYVNDGQEYCIVVRSDSNNYRVWISQLGDNIPGPSGDIRTISKQPYAGVLFKSQNASTWTAEQLQDLKFTIYRAKFDTSSVGTVTLKSANPALSKLEKDPFEFKAGNSKVRVFQESHGFVAGNVVIISGVTKTINGILSNVLNGAHTVINPQLDSYVIDLGASNVATATGYFGGKGISATRNIHYNTIQPHVRTQTFPSTTVNASVKCVNAQTGFYDTGFTSLQLNETHNFLYDEKSIITNAPHPSCILSLSLASANDSLSPMVDTHNSSLILVSNKIDKPTENSVATVGFDSFVWTSGNEYVSGDLIHYGQNLYKATSNGTFTSTPPTHTTGTVASMLYLGAYIPFFVSDMEPSGSTTYSKYVSKIVTLANPSSLFTIRLLANVPNRSDIEVYYRLSPAGSGVNVGTLNWNLATSESPITKVQNGVDTFSEVTYMKHSPDIKSFDAIQIKIAMKSDVTYAVPKIKNLRIIACV